jgi:hypothetical protein
LDRDPVKKAVRRARRQQRLGSEASCALCGVADQESLRIVEDPKLRDRIRQIVLERHHPLTSAQDPDLTIILCRTCHALATESLRCAGVPMMIQGNPLDRQIARCKAWGAFYRDAAGAEDRMVEALEEFSDFFDDEYADWRERWGNRK